MSGQAFLDWPALALSLFDAFLLCWLGFTVLLEADRRALGVWLSADGLFLGAAFFIAHTAILRNGWQWNSPLVNFWWRAGWWPLILSPFAWYCVILWYSGYWDDIDSHLHHRQAPWFGLILIATAGLLGWMVLSNPLPDLGSRSIDISGFLGLAILFPAYILLCILLALDAILRPGPTARLLGNEARRQARPWLTASTIVLLVVCLLVAFALVWGVQTFRSEYQTNAVASTEVFIPLTGLDVVIEILITIAILLIGQAAMVYEVFSSIPLPRSGLKKRWVFATWTGGLFAIVLSGFLIYFARPELAYLIFIPFLTAAMTLQNRQAAREQEMEAEQLRTLARPQQFYERIFTHPDKTGGTGEILAEFELICTNLLRTDQALLLPSGVLTSFLPEKIVYPREVILEKIPFESESGPDKPKLKPLDPVNSGGFRWAIPLVSTRGLEGWFFIGERLGGGFYTLEEIDIARAAVERWMDNQAAAEIARRLVNLQQQRQIETRLLDQKARRILHDDVLPLLHTALLAEPKSESASQISDAHQQISRLLRDAPPPPQADIARNGLLPALQKTAENEAELLQADLSFEIGPGVEKEIKTLSPQAAETVYYAARECLRNIQKHVLPPTEKKMEITIKTFVDGVLQISIENNGTEVPSIDEYTASSSGQGLSLHNALLAVFGGGMRLEHLQNGKTRATVTLPLNS
jgi:signal transduction histidine kinase